MKPGDRIPTWFSDELDGMSTVLEVLPYNGRYPQHFNCTLKLSAPRTRRGWLLKTHKIQTCAAIAKAKGE